MKIKKNIVYYFLIAGLTFAAIFLVGKKEAHDFELKAKTWWLNPDGQWVTIVQAVDTHSHIRFSTSSGDMIGLPVWAYDNANVIRLITEQPMSVTVTARSTNPPYVTRTLVLPSPADIFKSKLQLTVEPVGPHLVTLGFAWLGDPNAIQQYQIWRSDNHDAARMVGSPTSNSKTFQDVGVKPSTSYQYNLKAMGKDHMVASASLSVTTPPPMIAKSLDKISGKGMFIYIDPDNARSPFYYKKLMPPHIVRDAKQMGLRYVQLRTLYGVYSHFNHPGLIAWLTELLDLASENNIAVISWSIPRRDFTMAVEEDVRVAAMRTPSGNTFAGCGIDLEPGPDYMGKLPQAKEKMAHHVATFRRAVGPNYLVSSIVFTPWVTGFNNEIYPYRELAQNSDVFQPMEFWHHFYSSAHHQYTTQEVTQAVDQSIALLKKYAGRDIPVNVIGQLMDIGNTGVPSAQEITTALQAAKNGSAIGMSFFAWYETLIHSGGGLSQQGQAIADFPW